MLKGQLLQLHHQHDAAVAMRSQLLDPLAQLRPALGETINLDLLLPGHERQRVGNKLLALRPKASVDRRLVKRYAGDDAVADQHELYPFEDDA